VDITTTPPPKSLLQALVRSGAYQVSELFNRSGKLYRELKMKQKLKTMDEPQLLELLAKHGTLVKRPIVTDGTTCTVGFDLTAMKKAWG
jgi:arsenate reductase